MLQPCPVCKKLTEYGLHAPVEMSDVKCESCGGYAISFDLAVKLPQEPSWQGTITRLPLALRWASDRGTPATLKTPQDVMRLMGRFEKAEQARALMDDRFLFGSNTYMVESDPPPPGARDALYAEYILCDTTGKGFLDAFLKREGLWGARREAETRDVNDEGSKRTIVTAHHIDGAQPLPALTDSVG